MTERGVKLNRLRWRGVLLLVLGVLCLPATARAQYYKRIENFENASGRFYHRWTDDGGYTWSAWNAVPSSYYYDPSYNFSFVGNPAVVSDQPGRFWMVGKTSTGYLEYNVYSSSANAYQGWVRVPGTLQYGICGGPDNHCYSWNTDSNPALSSWGRGRLELFINATRDDGAIGLLHTWGDGSVWSGLWEVLGTGLMQGSPTAVSWSSGRTDVFVRGGGNELAHKWFANGSWSRGWENLGGYETASPAAVALYQGRLDVFVRGGEGALWRKGLSGSTWSNWEYLGGYIGDGTSPTAASRSSALVDAFVIGSDGYSFFQKNFNEYYGWSGFVNLGYAINPVAVAWFP